MSDLIERKEVTIDGTDCVVSLYDDLDTRPSDYDCYTADDVQAWQNGHWLFVTVEVKTDYDSACLSGVEYGRLGGKWIGIADIIDENGSDLLEEVNASNPLRVRVETEPGDHSLTIGRIYIGELEITAYQSVTRPGGITIEIDGPDSAVGLLAVNINDGEIFPGNEEEANR